MASAQTQRVRKVQSKMKGKGAILIDPGPVVVPEKIDPGTRRMLAALKRLADLGPYNFKKLKP